MYPEPCERSVLVIEQCFEPVMSKSCLKICAKRSFKSATIKWRSFGSESKGVTHLYIPLHRVVSRGEWKHSRH